MYINSAIEEYNYVRVSKLGIEHAYTRKRTVLIFACDNCGVEFRRLKGSMDPKRISNNYFHCCPDCDSKKFAQRKGVERKKIWDMPASSTLPINRF
jgi:ribosomal protein L37AE/L43A